MKKAILIALLFVLIAGISKAQTSAEWLQQKKVQKKYLLQQIAALQLYIGYARKGYTIARTGFTTISNFTKGEFNLHDTYIRSLIAVNPEVRRYVRVADIIALQVKIMQSYNRTYRLLNSSNTLTYDELAYVRRVFGRLLDDCEKTLEELIVITTDSQLTMKDNERIARIDNLYREMQEYFKFTEGFGNDAKLLAATRKKEQKDVEISRALQGIKNK